MIFENSILPENMSTSITKIASLDVISEAMGDLYNKTLVKKAQENTYAKAVSKLENSAKKGYSLAQTVLDALKGKAPKTNAIDVSSPSLGLDQQEAYAISGQLSELGYQVSKTTGASGASLQQAMEGYLGGSGEDVYAKDNDPDFHEDERADLFGETSGEETEVASSDYPRGTLPIGSTKGEKPTSGPYYPTRDSEESGIDYENYKESLPMSEEEREELNKRSLNSIKILNAIEKIANILDSAGFEKSAEVADELIEKVATEMTIEAAYDPSSPDPLGSFDLEGEELSVEGQTPILTEIDEDDDIYDKIEGAEVDPNFDLQKHLQMAQEKYENAVGEFDKAFYQETIRLIEEELEKQSL